ncbi:uncharacterized protein CELE_M04G7.5 [Caenorhabditis elegans]|uniref:Secreted protein n=1 Tax=Caenorhabditis elegans TaxID=6239 RepID=U4PLW2_CAEEL|nr:Secreted protein [Caenorhabditis elegans]CDH93051.1 Secreted protein [Caenorhabditis elegans]|eukprot:NP_001294338.1 Uncharacterized protein CELE_M04G7.5 [Caenorhabditis elegans]
MLRRWLWSPVVTVVQVPQCSCNRCFGNGCAPRCSYCPPRFGYSSCCNNNNFSCCGFRFRRSVEQVVKAETSEYSK